MWTQDDDGSGMTWPDALSYAESSEFAGYNDWRLPNAKELQSIIDYTRAPAVTNSAAIDPVFNCTPITDEGGSQNYPFYWSGTTHASFLDDATGGYGAYVCFGESLGWMEMPPGSGNYTLLDVHGAGAQRSDPKVGDPADWPYGNGPQGDVIRIYNFVRLVRDADSSMSLEESLLEENDIKIYPIPTDAKINIEKNNTEPGNLLIYDVFGRLVVSDSFGHEGNLQLDVSPLPDGLYIVKLFIASGTSSGRFIKN